MLSKISIDLDDTNRPCIKIQHIESDDLRDKVVEQFVKLLGTLASGAKAMKWESLPNHYSLRPDAKTYTIRPITGYKKPEEIESVRNLYEELTGIIGMPKVFAESFEGNGYHIKRDYDNNISIHFKSDSEKFEDTTVATITAIREVLAGIGAATESISNSKVFRELIDLADDIHKICGIEAYKTGEPIVADPAAEGDATKDPYVNTYQPTLGNRLGNALNSRGGAVDRYPEVGPYIINHEPLNEKVSFNDWFFQLNINRWAAAIGDDQLLLNGIVFPQDKRNYKIHEFADFFLIKKGNPINISVYGRIFEVRFKSEEREAKPEKETDRGYSEFYNPMKCTGQPQSIKPRVLKESAFLDEAKKSGSAALPKNKQAYTWQQLPNQVTIIPIHPKQSVSNFLTMIGLKETEIFEAAGENLWINETGVKKSNLNDHMIDIFKSSDLLKMIEDPFDVQIYNKIIEVTVLPK